MLHEEGWRVLSCPSCSSLAIFEHSVQVERAQLENGCQLEDLVCRVACSACGRAFRRDPTGLGRCETELDAEDGALWIPPPWQPPSLSADFELSWDVTMSMFAPQNGPLAHSELFAVIGELRRRGYGEHLRAGQSLSSFIVSRARAHGLTPQHSYVSIFVATDDAWQLEAQLSGSRTTLRGPRWELERMLSAFVAALAALPLE